jgi:hypothetical protein
MPKQTRKFLRKREYRSKCTSSLGRDGSIQLNPLFQPASDLIDQMKNIR